MKDLCLVAAAWGLLQPELSWLCFPRESKPAPESASTRVLPVFLLTLLFRAVQRGEQRGREEPSLPEQSSFWLCVFATES